jgi:glycosyltransferase involved in cell wall biosynthesis
LHNVGSLQYRRIAALKTGLLKQAGFRIKAALMQGWEARAAARFDCSLVVSDREAALLRADDASLRIEVIENGVDCERFQPLPEAADANALLFLGVLGYPPNSDGILWFIEEIWPSIRSASPAVRLRVAGHAPGPALMAANSLPGVRVEGRVEDVVPLYEEAGIVIVPLRAGGGTRLKILEAMALGRLVVSTTLGCEGLDVQPEEDLLIADSPAEFAAQVLRALGDPALRQRIAANARRQVESRYSWRKIGRRLLDVYSDLHAESKSAPGSRMKKTGAQ